jgi:hypothetical protein
MQIPATAQLLPTRSGEAISQLHAVIDAKMGHHKNREDWAGYINSAMSSSASKIPPHVGIFDKIADDEQQ